MAEALARADADICIWGTNEQKNSLASEKLTRHGIKVLALQCDVAVETAVEDAFAKTLDALGQVDACFANAGVGGQAKSFVEMTTAEWRRVMNVNLDGAFFTLRAAARHMCEHNIGGFFSGHRKPSCPGRPSLRTALRGHKRWAHFNDARHLQWDWHDMEFVPIQSYQDGSTPT